MKSLEELAAIRDKMKQTVNTREAAHDSTRVVAKFSEPLYPKSNSAIYRDL